MRLSTARDRDETRAVAVLHAALDAGVTLLDTADAYCLDAADTGHNERLIARALSTWTGDASKVQVATKGGLTRPDGRWEPDGRARALTGACEESLRALGLDRIPLYQLHAPDPRVPLATSLRALDALKRRGLVEAVGLCNVTVGHRRARSSGEDYWFFLLTSWPSCQVHWPSNHAAASESTPMPRAAGRLERRGARLQAGDRRGALNVR